VYRLGDANIVLFSEKQKSFLILFVLVLQIILRVFVALRLFVGKKE
jgi:hypothetical protein